ncbi:MAG: MBL fold metallo-hydrolase [Ruminococcaceae bacterium]|nr:MBL fold metallo-hydrolase [Oscillospiraceae bacterium]
MRIAFYGAAHEVTGSCTVLYAAGKTIMIDCGMEQGPDIYENGDLPILPSEIDYLLLTHAHIDHSGKIPALVAGGFKGHIYTTAATERLCQIMLLDSAYIQEFEARWRNRKAKRSGDEAYTPLYTTSDAQHAMEQFVSCNYDTEYALANNIKITFTDAGHLLGSASISVTVTEGDKTETIVFSGDLGNRRRPLICDPKQPPHADYVVIESTYGNRLHGERIDYVTQISRILQDTFDQGGNLIIPAFAVGRTQELLYLFRIIKEKNLIKGHANFPIYVDSPLAVDATEIYSSNLREFFDQETLDLLDIGINPIGFSGLRLSVTSEDSMAINKVPGPKVILSASGMCEAGRIRHHLKHNLWRKESTILFVGYQSEGTLGRAVLEGAETVKLFGEEIQVNARIEQLDGISSHADREMLLEWLSGFDKKPKTVFVNHGSDTVCDEFAVAVKEHLATDAVAPYNGAKYDLISGICLEEGNTKRILKNPPPKKNQRDASAYRQLLSAVKRLTIVADSYRHGANKDIAKFASQINSLCDKWD